MCAERGQLGIRKWRRETVVGEGGAGKESTGTSQRLDSAWSAERVHRYSGLHAKGNVTIEGSSDSGPRSMCQQRRRKIKHIGKRRVSLGTYEGIPVTAGAAGHVSL